MDLEIFDLELNSIDLIDKFVECEIEINYDKHSVLRLIVDASKKNLELLQEDRIITKSDDLERGYIVKHFEFMDDESSRILVEAPSINILLNTRIILGQQTFSGNIENVMKEFVNANAVNPADTKRRIPNLVLGANTGVNISADEGVSYAVLDEYLYEIANKYDVSWDIFLDHESKKFVFTVWQGTDKTTEQTVNNHVMFSKELDNIITQQYVKDDLNYKSTAIVAGEGEGVDRTLLTINDTLTGFDRKELFVDARDLQSEYRDENDNDIVLTPTQYRNLLIERGRNRLTEYPRIRTFESDIDMYSQFEYGFDYFVGDKVTIENDEVGIVMHTRIASAIELYTKDSDDLKLDFGSSIPDFIDNVKRMVK